MSKLWTKDAEREQLRKIEALIEETEVGSYIRMAFSGCVEMARNNIEFDFGDSYPDKIAQLENAYNMLEGKMNAENVEHGKTLKAVEYDRDTTRQYAEQLEERITTLEKLNESQKCEIEKLGHMCEEWERNAHDAGDLYCALEAECANKDDQIIALKAKLYDYITEER